MRSHRASCLRRAHGRIVWLAAAVWIAAALAPAAADAEWFGELYLGGASTRRTEVTLESPSGESRLPDVDFNRSSIFGGRAGYWFDYVGLGLDVSHFRPDTIPSPLRRFDLYVTPIAAVLMLRWPLLANAEFPHGRLQPYLALGPAVAFVEGKDTTNFFPTDQYDAGFFPGGQGGAGLAWQLQRNIALVGEYRFMHFSPKLRFNQNTLKTDLDTHAIVLGISLRY
jgi:opacity protein-like surface antigen